MSSPDGISGEINELSIAVINIILISRAGVRVLCWDSVWFTDRFSWGARKRCKYCPTTSEIISNWTVGPAMLRVNITDGLDHVRLWCYFQLVHQNPNSESRINVHLVLIFCSAVPLIDPLLLLFEMAWMLTRARMLITVYLPRTVPFLKGWKTHTTNRQCHIYVL